jgi:DNA-binding transcriptional LysR family regulator
VSRRLARLEQRLGVRLLRRTTRSLVLTDAGTAFYRHARIVLDAVAHAEESVRRTDDSVRGDLRVSLPPMADGSIYALLCEFAAAHPHLRLHLHFSAEQVDLRRDGYDVALRAGSAIEPGLIARTLARMPLIAAASPAYLAAWGVPRTTHELKQHRCLLGFARGALPTTHWPLVSGGQLRVEGALTSNDVIFLCDAAVRSQGIALLPTVIASPRLAEGSLVQVLAGKVGTTSQLAVVYPERELVPASVKAFVAALVAWGTEHFSPVQPPPPTKRKPAPTKPKRNRPKP